MKINQIQIVDWDENWFLKKEVVCNNNSYILYIFLAIYTDVLKMKYNIIK